MTEYRVGSKVPTNIYRVDEHHPEGIYIGHFCDLRVAARVVLALNALTANGNTATPHQEEHRGQ